MCGQFGFINVGTKNNYADDFIRDSFTTSMLRGVDSSGIASIDTLEGEHIIHKLPVAGNFFVTDRVTGNLIRATGDIHQLTMCHVRAATVGAIKLSNAHPFILEDNEDNVVIGTHNGTLTGWTTDPNARYFTTDSEWAISYILEEKADAFERFRGSFSFVWWDSREKVLNMARNCERPMAVAFLKSGAMAYASEAGMLYWLLERNKQELDGPIMFPDEDKLYKFPLGEPKNFTTTHLPKPSVTAHSSTNYYGSNYNRSYVYTNVEKVQAIIDRIAKEAANTAADPVEKVELVTEQEALNSYEFGWNDCDVEFTPVDTRSSDGATIGIAECFGAEFTAEIRGDVSKFSFSTTWKCKVLGIKETPQDQIMVLSLPYKVLELTPGD